MTRDALLSSSSLLTMSSDYHVLGHDLRSLPDSLFRKLACLGHGYDESLPTLFVLKCFLMYLPKMLARDLLRHIAASPASALLSSSLLLSSFVAVVINDPIPGHDRFGQ
jgi:O-methyltransferase involved in polyketide biosynthesis